MKPNMATCQGAWSLPYDVNPSFEDFRITAKVNVALTSIDVQLHDHIIVGQSWYSFADKGWIERTRTKYQEFIDSSNHIR